MILSIDIETSGLDPNVFEIISIGACAENMKTFYKEIKWDKLMVSPSSIEVNQIDLRQRNGIPLKEALQEFNKWIRTIFPEYEITDESNKIMALGFNVGSFDMIFLKKAYEKSNISEYPFSYRCIELNSCGFLLNVDKQQMAQEMWLECEKYIEVPIKHNALSDSVMSMLTWKRYKQMIII